MVKLQVWKSLQKPYLKVTLQWSKIYHRYSILHRLQMLIVSKSLLPCTISELSYKNLKDLKNSELWRPLAQDLSANVLNYRNKRWLNFTFLNSRHIYFQKYVMRMVEMLATAYYIQAKCTAFWGMHYINWSVFEKDRANWIGKRFQKWETSYSSIFKSILTMQKME